MEITGERVLHEQRWTVLKERTYRDCDGRTGRWTYVERPGGQQAVVIAALTADSDSLVVIEQFRVPMGQPVVEFPAGLVDPGEELAAAAHRELREETGFEGEVLEIGPGVSTTAGLATETIHMVFMRVGERPAAEPAPEGSERITVRLVEPGEFASFLEECRRQDRLLDAKLYLYLRERAREPAPARGPGNLRR